jgi:ectoine hydroxylase-related dioxygenase (phytanoyl-CoA dioxygenase family)
MQDCLHAVMDGFELSAIAYQELDQAGFTIIPGPVPAPDLAKVAVAYDSVTSSADPNDVKVGSSTARVRDFVNRGPEFDGLYLHPPVLVTAYSPAGSMIVFNGSVWHGHTMNRSVEPRRSIQGAYILRDADSGENLRARMLPETLSRISPLARYLLAVEP